MLGLVVGVCALGLLALLLRNQIRKRRRRKPSVELEGGAGDGEDFKPPLPENIQRSFTFWAGGLAGVASAAVTHQLDVAKTLRHVGKPMPDKFSDYFVGICMGSFAQGFRFGITLILNMTLQKRLDKWQKAAQSRGGCCSKLVSFGISMLAAGTGEFLANPPVVIKNYQIANNVGIATACEELWALGGPPRFFSGVGMGVLRKSLANGVVLQTIGPTKAALLASLPRLRSSQVTLSFVAGSLTGSFAEVITNPPDQVKTMTQAGVPFFEAVGLAARHPFRGAGFAGLRKGLIRGINWGGLTFFLAVFEWIYWKMTPFKPQRQISDLYKAELETHQEFVRKLSQEAET
eukprot:s6505_g1.t1